MEKIFLYLCSKIHIRYRYTFYLHYKEKKSNHKNEQNYKDLSIHMGRHDLVEVDYDLVTLSQSCRKKMLYFLYFLIASSYLFSTQRVLPVAFGNTGILVFS